ncbi:hypothetical protein [Cohnella fermenti]|uniref:Uncharacterized protein n=1 Tax=Cohnella fermenti TaxID=2565925 RepID=A0A4S4BRK2_9BACL|nr:hypothetical protein [Cohnella fermenti]THF77071.1 hypothetical protein E6C55_17030 [Cohnella fermenti]
MRLVEDRRYRIEQGGDPSGKTPIAGEAGLTAAELEDFAARRRLRIGEGGAQRYVDCGNAYGIRGDVAFCQALYEARWLSEKRLVPWAANRLPDLWGSTGRDERWTESFIEEHIRLLYRFAKAEELPGRATPELGRSAIRLQAIDELGYRGELRFWEDLNGKWSPFGFRYGQDVVAIWRNLELWATIRRERMEHIGRMERMERMERGTI